ncbi:MAG: peptidylprolyl isomerase [Betaproteobacteria bacterium]
MPQTLPLPHAAGSAGAAIARRWPNWLREPLLHFVVLGAALFVGDHVLFVRNDDPRTIVVGADVDAQARALFKASRGREPNAQELAALRQVWLDNEVLYREGLALQVDKGDPAIRERVIFKALSMVDASVKLPPVDDAVLRRWFEGHRAKYDEPPRFDFDEATLAGDSSEGGARSFAASLNAGASGDLGAGLRVFKGRPRENLLQSYGPEFAQALESAPPLQWQALRTREGWRVVRLDRATPGRPAAFEPLRTVVQQDWTDATLSEQRSAAVHSMARKYTIRTEAAPR